MRRFTELFERLDGTTSTLAKVEAMRAYFAEVPAEDGAWAVFLLSGRRFKRLVGPGLLRTWCREETGIPEWLFADAYAAVGDLAETVALLLDGDAEPETTSDLPLHRWIEERILPLRELDDDEKRSQIVGWWRHLPPGRLFVLNKMLTGGLRVGVSQTLTVRALAQVAGLDGPVLHHRLMGDWSPSADFFQALLAPETENEDISRPYPFYLAAPLEGEPDGLGAPDDWSAEWKWDGIRGQLIRRLGQTFLWSRGEELVTDRYPEIRDRAESLPDGTVLDGEILAWRDDAPLPFATLQKRIGRKKPGKKILVDAPVHFLVYDLLEDEGADLRSAPFNDRRRRLETRVEDLFPLSPQVDIPSWTSLAEARSTSRQRGVEGLMLKRRGSAYGVGRKKGDWWKWKVEPLTVDAVLIYAQSGHGRRATLLTDYTFAVWQDERLVPFAKAYSGLSDAEIRKLDRWLRRHTLERFGPVRSVEPEQVFEIAFEGIQRSTRHKSGIAVRFPRIKRWRDDLTPKDADTLDQVKELLAD